MAAAEAMAQSSVLPELYGAIHGSGPDWHTANFKDHGRRHGSSMTAAEFSSLKQWYSADSSGDRPMRRHIEPAGTSCYSEPVVQGAHASYYQRRQVSTAEPTAFRRGQRFVPEPLQRERPEGKRSLPEPYGAPPHNTHGVRPAPPELLHRDPGALPEPAMPRLARPYGICGLRECEREVVFEQEMGRKVRVGSVTYRGAGRAGDLSHVYGAPARPEDDPRFFKSLKDSPTFLRFVESLPPKPAVSPHQRRAAGAQRAAQAERAAARGLVASLELPEVDA